MEKANTTTEKIETFVKYVQILRGDEKGEAQVFCDRLFQAFGHDGYKEAGAILEERVKNKKSTKFADLVWKPRLLLEMKKRGEKLERHYRQAFEYWLNIVPNRPRYVVLCNFDEFWIYDFDQQLDTPVEQILLEELPARYASLNFLFPDNKKPIFGNNRIAVTRSAAGKVAKVFNSLIQRGEDRTHSQHFVLQCVMSMFAEDFDLLPRNLFTEIVDDCLGENNSYDLIGGLFRQMNDRQKARAGRYQKVPYFNGGLFDIIYPIQLTPTEIELLAAATQEDWSKVEPAIFGTIFENSMGKDDRHAYGAHFTREADIQKIILPTITRPWQQKIDEADSLKELLSLREELLQFIVLDPACGSGNFLYVAYRELKRLEMDLLEKIHANFRTAAQKVGTTSLVSLKQFYGIDKNSFAVELAKVTLMLAKELAIKEGNKVLQTVQSDLPLQIDNALPLDNLEDNIICSDALFENWVEADAIIGNPPYQAKNKMLEEYGREYLDKLRQKYPEIPGRADYCVYWFRKTHDELGIGKRAGLVGTNTIRQNYSRIGGLDYIVENQGTITEAVATQVWSGDAAVHVSIVNWLKGNEGGLKKLYRQEGDSEDSPWKVFELERISASLSEHLDVTKAKDLAVNINSGACYQGQTHGHAGFLLNEDEAREILKDKNSRDFVYPYIIGDDVLGNFESKPSRSAIDLSSCPDLVSAMRAGAAFRHVQQYVLPDMQANAENEREKTKKNIGPRQSHLNRWWKFWRDRPELFSKLSTISRYIACVRVTKRPIFVFIDSSIHPNDALQVFPLEDDYSFGILQSPLHWLWFNERCSTLKADFRYTSNTVFDSFPFPQSPTEAQVKQVAEKAVALRRIRAELLVQGNQNLRSLYRTLEIPGKHPLMIAHVELNFAVREAYGIKPKTDMLQYLLDLNFDLAEKEKAGGQITGPGLPSFIKSKEEFITNDKVSI
jgi:hypothetical protein